jgi:hypothetical protein
MNNVINRVLIISFIFIFVSSCLASPIYPINSLKNTQEIGLSNVYISSTGSDEGQGTPTSPFKSLNKSIDIVNPGGIIHIANGVYNGTLNRNLTIDKNITIINDNFNHGVGITAKIDAENADQIFIIQKGVKFILNNLTLSNGMSGDIDHDMGGALINYDSNVIIINCNFTGNHAHKIGGAISSLGNLTIENSTFTSNTAGESGGVGVGGAIYTSSESSSPIIKNSVFISNHATDSGGAAFNSGNLTIENSTFTSNNAEDQKEGVGGAIMNCGNLIITSSNFRSNTAGIIGEKGGGGAITNFENALSTITNTNFTYNVAGTGAGAVLNIGNLSIFNSNLNYNNAGQFGGGIVNSENITLTNVSASGNSAQYGGFIDNGAYHGDPITCSVLGGNFTGNNADKSGGAFYNTNTSIVNINGASFINNRADHYGGGIFNKGALNLKEGLIQNNIAYMYSGGGLGNEGNATVNGTFIIGNKASDGGGLDNFGNMTVERVLVKGNTALRGGGVSNSAKLTIIGSYIGECNALEGSLSLGGGVYNEGILQVIETNIANNVANWGGGIYNAGSTVLDGGYVMGNQARKGGGGAYILKTATFSGYQWIAGTNEPDAWKIGNRPV